MKHIKISFLLLVTGFSVGEAQEAPVLNPLQIPPNLSIGDNTELLCTLKRGSSPLIFSWLYNGINITSRKKYKVTTTETSSLLSIGKIQASDIGNYTCVASNRLGEDSGTVRVVIEGELK
ncbi:Down syndrome cell adhesion molecule-like protein Dscam2 [Stegodyphus dumicola]|uniref:Down syndrome cell adhesion molecule-like protein Dscam2 n=1 Tax=Stegodyphus dumicola TaxID=202533 RepID=UPI0015A77381|nr:Down syndrome cell adhesion molecule-like protein Dscam2 [Stegodyphus dumicola]